MDSWLEFLLLVQTTSSPQLSEEEIKGFDDKTSRAQWLKSHVFKRSHVYFLVVHADDLNNLQANEHGKSVGEMQYDILSGDR